MNWKSASNEFLIVKTSVVLTDRIDIVIADLDSFFKAAGLTAFVTSGLRDAKHQHTLIKNALINNNLDELYPEAFQNLEDRITYQGQTIYCWQPGWSKLLNIGYIINPPLPAKCLMDYYHQGSSVNKKGSIISQSPHFAGGAFDIGGGKDGITNEAMVIETAMGKVKGLKGYLLERNNNAIHCDTYPIN